MHAAPVIEQRGMLSGSNGSACSALAGEITLAKRRCGYTIAGTALCYVPEKKASYLELCPDSGL